MKRQNEIYHHTGLCKLFIMVIAILSLSSCNNEDDVIEIFTGKTWKLTYISEDGVHDWWDFWGGDNKAKGEFIQLLQNNKKYCTLTFNGADVNGVTGGSFGGQAISATISGQWSADGKSNKLTISSKTSGTESGAVGRAFIGGIENAKRYGGDNSHLYIYYEEGQRTFVLNFTPLVNNN